MSKRDKAKLKQLNYKVIQYLDQNMVLEAVLTSIKIRKLLKKNHLQHG